MKKSVVILLCLIFIVAIVSTVYGAALDSIQDRVENLEEKKEQYEDRSYWEQKWDYLGKEWKNILLGNPFVSMFDKFFTKISIVFRILFGMDYVFSATLFMVILLWLFLMFEGGNLIDSWGVFKGAVPYLLSALIAVGLSQALILKNLVIISGRLIFSPDHWFTRLILFLVVLFFFGVAHYLLALYSKFLRGRKKKVREKSAEIAQKSIIKFSEKFRKASSAK